MSFSRGTLRNLSHIVAVAGMLTAYACSSTPPAGEAGNPDAAPDASSTTSSADQVGSVPEDMLADEKGVEPSDPAAANTLAETGSNDPFGDLKEKDEPKNAEESTPVAEEGSDALPAPSESAAEASTGSGKMDTYTVKSGDTLMKIAFHLYGDVDRWKDLHELNQQKLKNGSALAKGMKLRYEAPNEAFEPQQHAHTYEIKKGDTLAGIAEDLYGKKMKYKKLQAYNKRLIKNPNRIFAGFTIYYDITEQEVAEAEAHRAQKSAGTAHAAPSAPTAPPAPPVAEVPSALSPPPPPAPVPNVAVTPSAIDNSAVPGPGSGAPAGGLPQPSPPTPQ